MAISTRKVFKGFLGFLLLPVTIICIASFISLLTRVRWHAYPYYLFIFGFVSYAPLFILNKKKSFAYVLGHEVLHALASIVFGGQLLSIFVSHSRGSVSTTKENFIVSLIPYCVPFYSLVLALGYITVSIFMDARPLYPLCIFFLGFSLSHHIILTTLYIKMGQSDISSQGIFFSYNIIFLSNVIIITLLMNVFLTKISIIDFWQETLGALRALLYRHY